MGTNFPHGVSSFGIPLFGLDFPLYPRGGNVWFVDGTNGANGNSGTSPTDAFATITFALSKALKGDTIYVLPKGMAATDTDPSSYAETVIMSVPQVSLIGVSRGRTQGGLPQMRIGSGSTAMITVRAPGCLIANLGINGDASTGGGILLDDDGGATKSAFGVTILNCHFKNCKGATATDAATGGAIQWAATGGAWQAYIKGCRFYKNVGDIVLKGTSGSVPQDVVIEDNVFGGPAASVDCQLFLSGGSGMNGVIIRNNEFTAFPALGSGANLRFIKATGCIGQLTGNRFASSALTFGAAGSGALIPTTMFMTDNYQEGGATQIVRT